MSGPRAALSFGALGIALAAATAVGLRARSVHRREAALGEAAATLAARQLTLREDVLAIRAGENRDYDRLAADVRALRAVRALGKEAPSAEVDAIVRDVAEEEHDVELFKTYEALFSSSSLAFPTAANLVPAQGAEVTALDALRTDVFRFVLAPDRDKAERVRSSVAVIESSPTALDGPGRERRAVALGLARALVEHRERLDGVVLTLVRSSVGYRQARVAEQHAERARRALVVLSAAATSVVFLALLAVVVAVELAGTRKRASATRSAPGG